jgi:hypothetical protein
MPSKGQSLPERQLHQHRGVPTNRRPFVKGVGDQWSPLLIAVALALTSCGKKQEEPKVAAPVPTPPPVVAPAPVVSDAKIEEEISKAFDTKEPLPDPKMSALPVDDAFADEVDDIMAKYPGKDATELLNVPEVNSKLKTALTKLAQDKALQQRVNSSVDLAAAIMGLDGGPGAHRMNLDLKSYDKPRTAKMLQAVVSEDPRRVVDYLVGELGEASVDLSYGGKDKAGNGISLVPNPSPPTPEKQPD